jgi:hypothetical protein
MSCGLALGASSAAQAQMKALVSDQPAPRTHAAEFNVPADGWTNDPDPLSDGMITREGSVPNSLLGFGLVKMRGRKRNGSDMRPGVVQEVQTRNPAVTFVLKF